MFDFTVCKKQDDMIKIIGCRLDKLCSFNKCKKALTKLNSNLSKNEVEALRE